MQCKHCENWIPDNAKFCQTCGKSLTSKSQNNGTTTSLILLVTVFVSGLAYLIVRMDAEKDKTQSPQNSQPQAAMPAASHPTQQIVSPTPQPTKVQVSPTPKPSVPLSQVSQSKEAQTIERVNPVAMGIVSDTFAVQPGQLRNFSFELDRVRTITGRFDVGGNRWSDIQVSLVALSEYDNLRNHRPYRAYYNSGQVVSDSINLVVPAGNYVLVFSNMHSLAAVATVRAVVSAID
jgi:hypothetical protein